MINHTPGPWNVLPVSCDVWGQGGYLICEVCPTYCMTEYKQANANLIAAAPELLNALEIAMEYLDGNQLEWANKARAIISKAKGIP